MLFHIIKNGISREDAGNICVTNRDMENVLFPINLNLEKANAAKLPTIRANNVEQVATIKLFII